MELTPAAPTAGSASTDPGTDRARDTSAARAAPYPINMWLGPAALVAALGRAVLHAPVPPPPPTLYIANDSALAGAADDAAEAAPQPRGIPDLHLTSRLKLGGNKMGKSEGAALRFSLGGGVDVGAGAYMGKSVQGGPSDTRFMAFIRLPFP